MDADTGILYSQRTGAGLLQMAMDCNGNAYGRVYALDGLDKKIATVVGDGNNFTISGILRLLQLKHRYGLEIHEYDYKLVVRTLERIDSLSPEEIIINPIVQDATVAQLIKVVVNARSPQDAHAELNRLEVYRILKDKFGIEMEKEMREMVIDLMRPNLDTIGEQHRESGQVLQSI